MNPEKLNKPRSKVSQEESNTNKIIEKTKELLGVKNRRPDLSKPFSNRELINNIKELDKVIESNPSGKVALIERGYARFELGLHKEAIEDYDKAIELDPSDKDTFVKRGYVKFKLGQHEAAIKDYDKAIELDPSYIPGLLNRAGVKEALGQIEAAIKDFDKIIRLHPKLDTAIKEKKRLMDKLNESDK